MKKIEEKFLNPENDPFHQQAKELGLVDGPIGDLSGPAPIERVEDLDEVKLFRTRAVVAILTSDVYDFGPATIKFDNPVPVYNDDMKKLGFAHIDLDDDRLVAEIAIDYSCDERLTVETGAMRLWPRVFGKMSVPALPLFDFQAKIPVIGLRIQGIQLSAVTPTDPRLEQFGQLVV